MVRAGGPGLDVYAATSTLADLPAVINGSHSALLVLDGVDGHGLDAVSRLSLTHPDVNTIVISTDQSADFLMQAMRSGVREGSKMRMICCRFCSCTRRRACRCGKRWFARASNPLPTFPMSPCSSGSAPASRGSDR